MTSNAILKQSRYDVSMAIWQESYYFQRNTIHMGAQLLQLLWLVGTGGKLWYIDCLVSHEWCSAVTWTSWRPKSLETPPFIEQLFHAFNKENIKAPHYWFLRTGHWWISPQTFNDWVIFFQNVISFSDAVHLMCNILIWNWSNTVNVKSALWILMPWCFSTMASVATVLTTHPCVSRCLRLTQSANNPETVSLAWRHHDVFRYKPIVLPLGRIYDG